MTKPYLKIRVLIADDHEVVRDGLQTMISKLDAVELIGEAENGDELIKMTRQLLPDVLLVDVKMPKCDGIEATKKIKTELPHIGIVAFSSFDEEHLIIDMLNAGANGYLLKNTSKEDLLAAIVAANKGRTFNSQEVNFRLAKMVERGGIFAQKKSPKESFNEREMKIIEMICEGYYSKEIAEAIGLSTRSVEGHREKIMEKMNVTNAAELAVFAIKYELYKPRK